MRIDNRNARFHYTFLDSFEAGIMLTGQEVKAIKAGHMNLKGAYITFRSGDFWLISAHVSPYQPKNVVGKAVDPNRERKLLLHSKEILNLRQKQQSQGLTIVPIKVYTKNGLIKVEIALARGKKAHDKRSVLKKRETDRQIRSLLKNKR